MRPHRFAFNLGYGFGASDPWMTDPTLLFTSMFLELGLELGVDSAAMEIEHRHGIDVNKFWEMWRVNPGNFFGLHVMNSLMALYFSFWAFSNLPTPFFCTSQHDPCSCTGGGFEIFATFCEAAQEAESAANKTAPEASNKTLAKITAAAKSEYGGLFEALQSNSVIVIGTIVSIFVIGLVFALARSQFLAADAEREKDEIEVQRLDLLEQNSKIQSQLALSELNEEQVEIVHAGAEALEAEVPARFKIGGSKKIEFEALLGSGSFGDCYKGRFHNMAVAVKQMRVVGRSFTCTPANEN